MQEKPMGQEPEKSLKSKVSSFERFWAGFGIGLGILGLIVGIVLWRVGFQPQVIPQAEITAITSNGTEFTDFSPAPAVSRELSVSGTSARIQGEWSLWLCVYSTDVQRFYAQELPISARGSWHHDHVYAGLEGNRDIGKDFLVTVVVADGEASKVLYHDAQITTTGLEHLPAGAVITDEVLVRRTE